MNLYLGTEQPVYICRIPERWLLNTETLWFERCIQSIRRVGSGDPILY